MKTYNVIDLYIAERVVFEMKDNNLTHEQEKELYNWDSLFRCDEKTQLELIERTKEKSLLNFITCSEESSDVFEKTEDRVRRNLIKSSINLFLLCHDDYGGAVANLFSTDENVELKDETFEDNSNTKVSIKFISKEEAFDLYKNRTDYDTLFRPFW